MLKVACRAVAGAVGAKNPLSQQPVFPPVAAPFQSERRNRLDGRSNKSTQRGSAPGRDADGDNASPPDSTHTQNDPEPPPSL